MGEVGVRLARCCYCCYCCCYCSSDSWRIKNRMSVRACGTQESITKLALHGFELAFHEPSPNSPCPQSVPGLKVGVYREGVVCVLELRWAFTTLQAY